jgi:hypothetical protein
MIGWVGPHPDPSRPSRPIIAMIGTLRADRDRPRPGGRVGRADRSVPVGVAPWGSCRHYNPTARLVTRCAKTTLRSDPIRGAGCTRGAGCIGPILCSRMRTREQHKGLGADRPGSRGQGGARVPGAREQGDDQGPGCQGSRGHAASDRPSAPAPGEQHQHQGDDQHQGAPRSRETTRGAGRREGPTDQGPAPAPGARETSDQHQEGRVHQGPASGSREGPAPGAGRIDQGAGCTREHQGPGSTRGQGSRGAGRRPDRAGSGRIDQGSR